MHIPIARQGYPFIAGGLAGIALFFWLDFPLGWGIFGLLTLFVISFFRDPERQSPQEEGAVLSPADGRILLVEEKEMTPFSTRSAIKISIFMSVFNCHVNRIPVSGKIEKVFYRTGKFYSANLDRASAQNEQNALLLFTKEGHEISMVQVAGLIARRIVCWVNQGETIKRGERFGLIRFGSRVDLYLPASTRIRIQRGDKVKAGLTIIGELP
ncbi:MAG: phosphatidylserine decarboxylase [Deltaproteobacteria bacterium RBG_13_43_22]|nr:MAG: phosphatidylserine decarboxylase [Deltaproteobacteria bacterium RBG_13_43_22]